MPCLETDIEMEVNGAKLASHSSLHVGTSPLFSNCYSVIIAERGVGEAVILARFIFTLQRVYAEISKCWPVRHVIRLTLDWTLFMNYAARLCVWEYKRFSNEFLSHHVITSLSFFCTNLMLQTLRISPTSLLALFVTSEESATRGMVFKAIFVSSFG